jgi:exodeoxyribonuclease V alpha subunit
VKPRANANTQLRGIVERVVFHTEDTGYCILKVQPEGGREVVSLIGKAPRVVAGEQFEAQGKWEQNSEFGRQFKAETIRLSRPDSLVGIERYLGSGLIDGIGPKYAKRMIEKFGKEVFDIIENFSVRLQEVEGVGSKRRREIRESWMKQKTVHNIMLFLHEHGISTSRAQRIFKTYGEEALEVLRKNPYRLAADIQGVGFKTADEIAGQMGVARESPERLRAGLLYALENAAGVGHCCMPEEELLKQGSELLATQAEVLIPQLEHLVLTRELERHSIQSSEMIYLPHLRAAEQVISQRLIEMVGRPVEYPEIEVERAIQWAAEKTRKSLAQSQQQAVRQALQNRVLIITGGPGVGKTTILNTILIILKAKEIKITLAAPTGRAAKRMTESTGMEAMTLHRLLEYQGDGQWGKNQAKRLKGDLFVVDEASMIDAPLMSHFLAALSQEAHLLVVGDADQLPSVGPGMVLADLISSGRIPCVHLTEIFRQAADSRIVTSAHEVNRGHIPDLKPHPKSDFFFIEQTRPEEIRDTIVGLVRDRLPAKYRFDPVRDIQVLTPMNRHQLGTRLLNQDLQTAINPPNELKFEIERFGTKFRVGDKIIQTRNNYDKEVFNGDIGHIVSIETEPMKVVVRFDSRLVDYEPGDLDELQLAYALTIHKSQGSEFPCVVIPLSTQHFVLLERSLLYTAITRAKRLVVLVGDPKALALAVRKQENRRRFTGLESLLAAKSST